MPRPTWRVLKAWHAMHCDAYTPKGWTVCICVHCKGSCTFCARAPRPLLGSSHPLPATMLSAGHLLQDERAAARPVQRLPGIGASDGWGPLRPVHEDWHHQPVQRGQCPAAACFEAAPSASCPDEAADTVRHCSLSSCWLLAAGRVKPAEGTSAVGTLTHAQVRFVFLTC